MQTTFWVVLEAKRGYWDASAIRSITAKTLRQNKPALKADEITVRLTLDVNPDVFTEPVYSVSAIVPDAMVVPGPALIIEEPPVEEPAEEVSPA